jgi:two-component system sensor histidine kinase/response regulator
MVIMPLVLIVDDEMYQRTLIRETLSSDESLRFVEAENGRVGLEQAQLINPDVILLDVMMPILDGFEVCKRLKADPVLRPVPVILVTAMGRLQDKVTGLDAGADDFVNKPFEEMELQARVRSALRVKQMHDQIGEMNHLRDSLVRMIMHDMGNMVGVISSALTLYDRMPPDSGEAVGFVRDAYEANVMLGDMIDDALDIGSLEAKKMPIKREPTDLADLLSSLLTRFNGAAMVNEVAIELQIDPGLNTIANVDKGLIRRVIGNLLTNALKYAPRSSTILVCASSTSTNRAFVLSISDEGPGIPIEEQGYVFDKYAQAKRYTAHQERPGRGLGLTFSRMAVEAHNGQIKVHSTPGEGTTFTIEIPYA